MELTETQTDIWEQLGNSANATKQIRQNALIFYIQYRQHLKESHSFINTQTNIQNLLLIAYFISQKTQIVYSLQGEQIKNIALSINQLAKKNSDYKELLYHLKQMVRTITIPQNARHIQDQINSFMKYFSFVMTFYNKLSSTFDKIIFRSNLTKSQWQIIGGQTLYNQKIKGLLWLIFINFRKQVFNSNMDTIDNTCLLACAFIFLIEQKYKEDKICSIYSNQIVQQGTFPNLRHQVEQVFLKYFNLHDINSFKKVQHLFCTYASKNQFKIDYDQMFSVKKIEINTKKLHSYYQKLMEYTQIDQRLFLKNKTSVHNLKFTQWGAKRKINRFQTNAIHSKRVLNFDNQYEDVNQNDKTIKINQEQNKDKFNRKFLKNISKNMTTTPLLTLGDKYKQTPFTKFQQTCNWVHRKCLKYPLAKTNQDQFFNKFLLELLQIGVKNDERQLSNNQILQKKSMIYSLFRQILTLIETLQKSQEISLILALQTVYYILNITNREMSALIQYLDVQWFQFWKGLDFFMNYDNLMPNQLKTHLLMLETSIVSFFIWKQKKFIEKISQTNSVKCASFVRFQSRVLHHIAYQLNFLCLALQISLQSSLMDDAFIICQNFYKQHMEEKIMVNIDQIILCSIYSVCRAKNIDIKFKKIMAEYKTINAMEQKLFQQMIDEVQIQNQRATIIQFYNHVFVRKAKPILLKVKNGNLQISQISNSNSYILSPKKVIPQIVSETISTPNMTPGNCMLYAYNQSPLLKKSKQLKINFGDLRSKQNESHNTVSKSKSQHLRLDDCSQIESINQMFNKKFGKGLNLNQNQNFMNKG